MRRGHSSGGWRSENQRHFGPRAGGIPRFRPSRSYGPQDAPRFPHPSPRYRQYQPHSMHLEDRRPPDNHDRNSYRGSSHHSNQSRSQERGPRDRTILPYLQPQRHKDSDHSNFQAPNFYDDIPNMSFNVNNMGDVDLRQTPNMPQNRNTYSKPIPVWTNQTFDKPFYHDHRSPHKTPRDHHANEGGLSQEYTGHRPPASDHYAATPCSNNNNTAYSRSVDDTVDIVRKRLMNRDSQPPPDPCEMDQDMRQSSIENYIPTHEQPVKKKTPRQKQNIKSNCDKMKNKIVHQLFKMDKDKIHKLMDNPSSSSKFEYAISSLITESQNSLHRHQRSIAEKSLCSSRTDFIHHDNNTIYEDTFMKQMQCILDPQDTILLEDIKPLVLAELNKVLQLEDFERFEGVEDVYSRNEMPIFNETRNEVSNYNDTRNEMSHYNDPHEEPYSDNYYNSGEHSVGSSNNMTSSRNDYNYPDTQDTEQKYMVDTKSLFQRRPAKQIDLQNERKSSESQYSRQSIDKPNENIFRAKEEPMPLFNPNTDELSEDDDPFADLDNQYHVAVDHNFIETEDIISNESFPSIPNNDNVQVNTSHYSTRIKKEIEVQSPLKLFPIPDDNNEVEKSQNNEICSVLKKELLTPVEEQHAHLEKSVLAETITPPEDKSSKTKSAEPLAPVDSLTLKSSTQHNPRKRSIDQKPAHRKEKRKKSESELTSCQEIASCIVNTILSKENKQETPKVSVSKKKESTNKGYSEKYVKRRDSHRKSRDSESKGSAQKKPQHSNSEHHSTVSPKDSFNNTSTKSDPKVKLKTIDMFMEQPKKATTHTPHRNTATPLATVKSPDENNKPKLFTPTIQYSFARKLIKKHVGTQVIRHYKDTCSQTETKKLCTKHIQTDPVSFSKTVSTSKDPFERMKEIDLEIQVLLQEKFKLYNSIESKDSSNSSTMEKLGMTVLNVPIEVHNEDNSIEEPSPDAIAEDFTNIPVEELEDIAMESIANSRESPKNNRRIKALNPSRKASESPTTRRANRKLKTPNISLLEQIITDDRPIEDIISLDDLERTPAKSKKRPQRPTSKKKNTKKGKATKTNPRNETYDLKECSVILIRTDISNFIESQSASQSLQGEYTHSEHSTEDRVPSPSSTKSQTLTTEEVNEIVSVKSNEIEESVVNDLQFDMLDVSEDIVIGDHCEVKNEKDIEIEKVVISEEMIVDNSQSSVEDTAVASEVGPTECRIYDYSTDENLRRDSLVVSGNADAVLAIECIENDFIAACLDGNVYHFSGDGQLVNTLRGSNHAVTCVTIVKEKFGTTVYTGSLDSRIRYYDLETGLEKGPECNVLSPIQTMDRAWDTVFVGTRTGFVLQFECKNNMLIPVSTVKFSDQSILALRAIKEGPRKVLLVAARSEDVTIKDAQTGLLLRSLSGPKMTVYTLLFEDGKVYCGTSSHQIHVFDYASGTHVGAHEGGKGAVCLRATGGLVFAGCYDGCVYVYREGETRPLAQLRGPSLMLLSLAIVGSKIIAGYKDRSLYIWKIPLAILQEMIL